jgi:hypothetical protein
MRSEELTPAELEAGLRANLAARGEGPPADWLVAEIRSGEWQQRQKRNQRNIQRSMMGTAIARRSMRPAPSIVRRISATPRPSATTPRVHARRARSPGRLDDDEPEPPEPLAAWSGLFRCVRSHEDAFAAACCGDEGCVTVAPCVVILLGLEERPRIYLDAATELEERRLRMWLESSGYWRRLVEPAFEIAEEKRAA